ncbi:hypothetical protein ACFL2U_03415 [Patescibacteria group bacterium]
MKKFLLFLLLVFLVLTITSCGWVRSKPAKILSFESCQNECVIKGFDEGTCLSYFEAEGKASDIGNCLIEGSANCGDKGQCHCYCLYQEKDDLDFLLEDVKRQTGINFEDIQITEMDWSSEYGKLALSGKGYRIIQISSQEIEKIKQYFIDNGFTEDEYNSNLGRITDNYGYIKDDLACLVSLSAILDEQDQPLAGDLNIIKIRCTQYNN